jgi:hypothetical protein
MPGRARGEGGFDPAVIRHPTVPDPRHWTHGAGPGAMTGM